jgi:hypothetical protein
MALWGKEDKTTARPKSIKLNSDGSIAQDASGKKLVFLSKEEAQANSNKGASGAGWYTVLTSNAGTPNERVRLELLIAIADENRATVDNVEFTESHLLSSDPMVYADGGMGVEDPEGRPGWYFVNPQTVETPSGPVVRNKINWYFYAGADNITLGDFSAYAVITSDDVSNDNAPFFGIYTAVLNDGQDAATWYRSRKVYVPTATITPGTKYLIYFGTNPSVHTQLPRIQLVPSPVAGSNRGPQAANEVVSLASLGTNSAAQPGRVKFVAENIGIVSPTVKRDIELRLDSSNKLETDSGLE